MGSVYRGYRRGRVMEKGVFGKERMLKVGGGKLIVYGG